MGTNYYTTKNLCSHCEKGGEIVHIGKSSSGWCFALHVIPELNLHTLDDWKDFLQDKKIMDEYENEIPLWKLLKTITERKNEDCFLSHGYASWGEFHRVNHSQIGPYGLLRAKIGNYCIGHGSGTWDYVIGDFS